MFRNKELPTQSTRQLQDAELDMVTGGVIDGCIRLPIVDQIIKSSDWTFKDVFAKRTIGR